MTMTTIKHSWMLRMRCRGRESLLDNDSELPYPTKEVKELCQRCAVRVECLNWGWLEEFGIYGGTTSYQREQLRAMRSRARCPDCSSRQTEVLDAVQVCIGCGMSWPTRR